MTDLNRYELAAALHQQGKTIEEIAQTLNIAPATAGNYVRRGALKERENPPRHLKGHRRVTILENGRRAVLVWDTHDNREEAFARALAAGYTQKATAYIFGVSPATLNESSAVVGRGLRQKRHRPYMRLNAGTLDAVKKFAAKNFLETNVAASHLIEAGIRALAE